MLKIAFLIPPSEWKNTWWIHKKEKLSFSFSKPENISINASEKDLKCKWDRYKEGIKLNRKLIDYKSSKTWEDKSYNDYIEAIYRYSWVMYSAIDYDNMSDEWKKFFEEKFFILSWMYGKLKPLDIIWNYKLPVETKGLYDHWWHSIPDTLVSLKLDYIVNLLPISYSKLIWLWTDCNRHKKKLNPVIDSGAKIININFLKPDWKKISHWVKKIKWERIKYVCENSLTDYHSFWWEVLENGDFIDVNIFKY